ncbi:hypothetical protein THAOC_28631, partial [Thalassiosira oceanica]
MAVPSRKSLPMQVESVEWSEDWKEVADSDWCMRLLTVPVEINRYIIKISTILFSILFISDTKKWVGISYKISTILFSILFIMVHFHSMSTKSDWVTDKTLINGHSLRQVARGIRVDTSQHGQLTKQSIESEVPPLVQSWAHSRGSLPDSSRCLRQALL